MLLHFSFFCFIFLGINSNFSASMMYQFCAFVLFENLVREKLTDLKRVEGNVTG